MEDNIGWLAYHFIAFQSKLVSLYYIHLYIYLFSIYLFYLHKKGNEDIILQYCITLNIVNHILQT
jgi:hypothetical protein